MTVEPSDADIHSCSESVQAYIKDLEDQISALTEKTGTYIVTLGNNRYGPYDTVQDAYGKCAKNMHQTSSWSISAIEEYK